MSFASRLASLHGRSLRQFCAELGLGLQSMLDGKPETLARLATLTDAPFGRLLGNTIVRGGPRGFAWRGLALGGGNLSRRTVRVCPRCIREDVARAASDEGHGPYGRAAWLLRSVRTCQDHQVALIELPSLPLDAYDFVRIVEQFLQTSRDGADVERERLPSALETYVLDRSIARARPDAGWLDALEASAVIDACEGLGAVVAFGRTVSASRFDQDAWRVAGDVGFAILSGGPPAIRKALSVMDAQAPGLGPGDRAQVPRYGSFQVFLTRQRERRPDLEPVCRVVSDHIRWTTPVGPGDSVLGMRVEERYVHSVRTAADAYGLGTTMLRRLLREAGVLEEASDALCDADTLFDARANAALLAAAATTVPRDRVHAYLNASREQARAIKRGGLIPTLLDGTGTSKALARQYRPADLDAFLARLCADAHEIGPRDTGAMTIQQAASRAGCDSVTVVRLILEKKLPWVGRLKGVCGFKAVVVHPTHVRALLEGEGRGVWSPTALANELKLKEGVVGKLIDAGLLRAEIRVQRSNGRDERMIDDEEVRRFRETYVWIGMRGEVGTSQTTLASRGVLPALRRSDFGQNFYLRSEVIAVAGQDAPVPTGQPDVERRPAGANEVRNAIIRCPRAPDGASSQWNPERAGIHDGSEEQPDSRVDGVVGDMPRVNVRARDA